MLSKEVGLVSRGHHRTGIVGGAFLPSDVSLGLPHGLGSDHRQCAWLPARLVEQYQQPWPEHQGSRPTFVRRKLPVCAKGSS